MPAPDKNRDVNDIPSVPVSFDKNIGGANWGHMDSGLEPTDFADIKNFDLDPVLSLRKRNGSAVFYPGQYYADGQLHDEIGHSFIVGMVYWQRPAGGGRFLVFNQDSDWGLCERYWDGILTPLPFWSDQ